MYQSGRWLSQSIDSDIASSSSSTTNGQAVHQHGNISIGKIKLFETIPVKDEYYRTRRYKKCFIGKDAVTFMVESNMASSREDAVLLGLRLMNEFNLFEHVHRDHVFKDAHLFYRFVPHQKRFLPFLDDLDATLALHQDLHAYDDSGALSITSSSSSSSSNEYDSDENYELIDIAKELERGVEIKDRTYHWKTYQDCFVGSDAIDFLVSHGYVKSRIDAVDLGRRISSELNLFQHATGNHVLKDDYLFYRFTNDEMRVYHEGKSSKGELSIEEQAKIFESGVNVGTNRYHMKSYPHTFVGSQAVDFMIQHGITNSRVAAVDLGRKMVTELGLFHHVTNDHDFRDDHLFYRFSPVDDRLITDIATKSMLKSSNLEAIGEIFRNGVVVKDMKRGRKTYTKCFVAADAVSFLVDSSLAQTRKEAVILGRTLKSRLNLFEDVNKKRNGTDLRPFSDDDVLFGFSADSIHQLSVSTSVSSIDSDNDLKEIADKFRSGITLKDRVWHFKIYRDCFVGTHAVDFFLASKIAKTRVEAVEIGRDVMKTFGLFHHVSNENEHDFEDDHLFYRFSPGPIHVHKGSLLGRNRVELHATAKQFEQEIKVKDNRVGFRLYRGTFSGKDIVSYLIESEIASSRANAIHIGRLFQEEFNLFQDVSKITYNEGVSCSIRRPTNKFKGIELRIYRFTPVNQRWFWEEEQDTDDDLESHVLELGVVSDDQEWAERVKLFERKKLVSLYSPSRSYRPNEDIQLSRAKTWASKFYRSDPRFQIYRYFLDVSQVGAADIEQYKVEVEKVRPLLRYVCRSSLFSVWRPTSRDAIKRMMKGEGVGKGLDIKGKSAKRGKLSGYVPFLQISKNKHKKLIRPLPKLGKIRLFFIGADGGAARDNCANKLENVMMMMIEVVEHSKKILNDNRSTDKDRKDALDGMYLDLEDPSIEYIDEYLPKIHGLEIPVRLLWETFIYRQDISRRIGSQYDCGRPSQPAFQDMNITALQAPTVFGKPKAVLIQNASTSDNLNPFELLMAYEENGKVIPVVSDFDNLLVGTRGVSYNSPLPSDQIEYLKYMVSSIEKIHDKPCSQPWTSRWLEILKEQSNAGVHPNIPQFGFGDPKSIGLIKTLTKRLSNNGAVRHGSESFNYYFPQELDEEFLIIYDGHNPDQNGLKWEYVGVAGLQKILNDKIDEGFTFPLNPKWILCDQGWSKIYQKLLSSNHRNVQESLDVWFPPESGIKSHIERICKNHPEGFQREQMSTVECSTSTL